MITTTEILISPPQPAPTIRKRHAKFKFDGPAGRSSAPGKRNRDVLDWSEMPAFLVSCSPVGRWYLFFAVSLVSGISALVAQQAPRRDSRPPQEQVSSPPTQQPAQQQPAQSQPPAPAPAQQENPAAQAAHAQLPPPRRTLSVVVLDPGHGGADSGARGGTGAVEKDVVLSLAKATRADLERLGFRVVMTRQEDEDPPYDDRAATANAQRDAIFISLHVSSTGPIGTVRTYYYHLDAPIAAVQTKAAAFPGREWPFRWEQAQLPFVDTSHKLADLVQGEFARTFPGSPQLGTAVPERALRSVATPAVAIEISSVAVSDSQILMNAAAPLADAISRAAAAFRPVYEAEMN
jgi:N-acetylmuramoyl-L-alanine amidase